MEILKLWKPQDLFVIKTSKQSLRVVLVVFAVVCGIYIFSMCINQTSNYLSQANSLSIHVINRHNCHYPVFQQEAIHYLHFPKPQTFNRKECACNPVRFFAILSMQRSGSGWFETLLNSHINVSSNGEIFGAKSRRTNASVVLEIMDKVFNLDWYSSSSKNECSAAVGFKWMLNQGAFEYHEEIVDYFNRRGVSAIFLFRRNLLRRLISQLANSYDKDTKPLNGTHKSHVHSPYEAEVLAKYKPVVNMTLLIPNLRHAERKAAKALECFKSTRHIVLYYEDIVQNRTKLADVQEFLGLPQRELKSGQVKIHSGPLSQQIQNWDDVKKKLKGTPYETFLNAD
ncbi:PREDICTED: uncharacterized protein LOC109211725 [Nicotiana attenuata]|uniref:Sulfotransferase n=1 Tax=Nicotiana attenuata TaxID=49451 RepID=A0A314KIG1_NICAT|nr:PREDICTED: uncharacterized protein LOC109211725 [Nicotiana attenuata]OIT29156.1 hypothetical protein A4A49_17782 [Nicotiana attenuata]